MIYPIHLYIDQKNRQLKARIQQDFIQKITHMKGKWFDVENVLWQLHAAVNADDTMNNLFEAFGERVNSFQGVAIADRFDNF